MKKKSWIAWIPKLREVDQSIYEVAENCFRMSYVYSKKETKEKWIPEWWPPKKVRIIIEEVK